MVGVRMTVWVGQGVGGQLLLLLLRLGGGMTMAVGGVKSWGWSKGRVGVTRPLAQSQAKMVMGPLLYQELLQAAIGRDPGQEILIGRKHATKLLM